jgi:hypothetical protein
VTDSNEWGDELHLLEQIMLGILLCHRTFETRYRSGKSSFSHIFVKAPMGSFSLDKIFQGVAYENIKLKDGIDMEVYENLNIVNYDWHNPRDPTTLEK